MQTEMDLSTEYAVSDALLAKRVAATQLRRDVKAVNDALYGMGRVYHDGVPLDAVNSLLTHYGFDVPDTFLVCGHEGRLNESVGRGKYLSLSWYRMASGRFEVVAYVS